MRDARAWSAVGAWRRLPRSFLPIWVVEHGTNLIVAANEAADVAYGYSLGGLLGRGASEICSDSHALVAVASFRVPGVCSVVHRRRDGAVFDADVGMVRFDGSRPATMVMLHVALTQGSPRDRVASRR